MSYGEKITAQRPSSWMPSSCGSTWRTRAATGCAGGGGLRVAERDLADVEAAVGGREEWIVGRDALERVAGQRGGQFAAEGGRRTACSRRSSRPAACRRARGTRASRVRSASVRRKSCRPCMNTRWIAEQVRVGDVDQLGRGADLQLQLALRRGAQQVHQRAGRVVAAAAVAELGDLDDAAGCRSLRSTSSASGVSKLCSLPFGSRLVA